MKNSAGRALFKRRRYNGNHKCSHSKSASVYVERIIKLESQCSGCEWTLSGSISCPLKHIPLATPAGPDGAGPCVPMNQCWLLYSFRPGLFQVSCLRELQIMWSTLTLIISDSRERRALSLHTIKATVLPWRTCFRVKRGTRVHTKSSLLSPHRPALWEAANIQSFDQAPP